MIPVLPFIFLGIPLLMYLGQGWGFYFPRRRIGMAIAMTGYAIGNIGLIIDAIERGDAAE